MRLSAGLCVALSFALIAGLTGCASTPQASQARDDEAKQFGSNPATSTVYVYRTDTADDDGVLWIDGRLIGSTLPRTYFRVHLDPGRHLITGMAADNGRIALETRPGKVYFVSVAMHAGQSNFQQIPAETARKVVVTCCSLLENWVPGQRPLLR